MSVHPRLGVRDSSSFSCPFCVCSTVTTGTDDDDVAVVLHSMPQCSRFKLLSHKDFIRDAKAARESNAGIGLGR